MNSFPIWHAYFLLKVYLCVRGSIALAAVPNLAFLAFIALPSPAWLARRRELRVARELVNGGLAVALLWHDSYLPPPQRGWAQLEDQGMPSLAYVVSFVAGFFDWPLLVAVLGGLMVGLALRRHRLLAVAVTAAALLVAPRYVAWAADREAARSRPVSSGPQGPEAVRSDFFAREAERVVLFKKPAPPPFDIVVVHVCSMAWSDLKAVRLDQHAFFKGMHYVFTDFNSVSSYSNPAVMRLLRANCGQQTHTDLHNPTPSACLLFESLKSAGYRNYVAMSHDGKYGNYTQDIRKNGLADATFLFPEKLPPQSIFFDNSKMFSDLDMLRRWLVARNAAAEPRAALYFNSVNLHAGSHWVDEKKWWARDPHEQYEDFASFLLHGLQQFMTSLAQSERNVVVVFVPEHGRALQPTPMQGRDLRDIPLPGITRVPVGIRLIGPGFAAPPQPILVDKPTSYLALSWLLARFVEKSPFGAGAEAPADLVRKIPATDFVSEHSGTTIVELDGAYYMNQAEKSKEWIRLTAAQLGE